jgi:hypothetical protein
MMSAMKCSVLPGLLVLSSTLFLTACNDLRYVNESITITDDFSFTDDVAKTKYTVTQPGVVVEGNGFTIDGDCNTDCIGLTIVADDVTVRNLTIRNFDGGVSINRQAAGVRFENVTVTDNVNHGIFVNVGASRFSCDTCDISDNGSMGIYLEYNSHGATITNSRIVGNGYRDKDSGDWIEDLKAESKDDREGIAIDASQGNTISNTYFADNALTGVTLYKNCGERGITREWGANYNRIVGGRVEDGIHIASRQDKNLSDWSCSDPYIYQNAYVADEAEHNIVDGVTLGPSATLAVQDDNNQIIGVTGGSIVITSTVRAALNQPITGVTTTNTDSTIYR